MLISLAVLPLVSGCVGPERKKEMLVKNAEPCLNNTKALDTALACLKQNGFKDWHDHKNTLIFNSCGPYWGYPLVASCAYIFIEHDSNLIKSYKFQAALDGV